MLSNTKEKNITSSPEPISLKATRKILDEMNNSICRIYNNSKGTGFFVKIPYKSKLLPVLITTNNIINQKDIINDSNILLSLNNDKIIKRIKLSKNRLIYTNERLDITIVEIKENEDSLNINYLELDDQIINYFKFKNNEGQNYFDESIYLLNYSCDQDIVVSYGKLIDINNTELIHNCNIKREASGSPILLVNNQKLIGIHYGNSKLYKYNKGKLLIYSIIEFSKIKCNYIINKKYESIDHHETQISYIIGELDIEEDNQKIKIINSYKKLNEEEIKDNCEIRINGKIIPFSYLYQFKESGKYAISYNFKKNITKANCMFSGCSSLIKIDLSNFNTNNITDMSYMFNGCSSLTKIDLSHINTMTMNVTNMNGMFFDCSSLTNIDLFYFNTNNVTNMSKMFGNCSSLTNIDLSIFNTSNVKDMSGMFSKCSSLENINLLNFSTYNVTNMSSMFNECSSLENINLLNFSTYNVTNMSSMFSGCSSLTNIDLSKFNTNNVKDMSNMFSHCSSLININLSNFNTSNVTDMNNMFYYCSSLKNINISNFNTKKVYDMSSMFRRCESLTKLNLYNFNISNASSLNSMFEECSSLTNLNLLNFHTNKSTNLHGMFYGCVKLSQFNIIVFDKNIIKEFIQK